MPTAPTDDTVSMMALLLVFRIGRGPHGDQRGVLLVRVERVPEVMPVLEQLGRRHKM